MRTTSTDRQLTEGERAHGIAMLRRREPLNEIAEALGLTPAATVRELRTAVAVAPPPTRELTIREQLGHEKLRFFCSRCVYEARHFGDIIAHYQRAHERTP